ncbi:MAG: glucose 1-dehydrogenase [Rhodospirillales bacterium]|nr:glucose 1-dehydrogenase [Rhodospirillales bacterium]
MRLANKVALVTGGGSGFGEGIAKRFAVEGAKVAVVDLREEAAGRVAEEIAVAGNTAIAIGADVADRAQSQAMIDRTVQAFGRLDVLVNNAGISHKNQPLLKVTEEELDRVYNVNVKAIYLAAYAAVPLFRSQGGGVIINTSSTAGLRPRPGLCWYNASKGAVNMLTKSMAVELASDRIRVNALCPVAGETPLLETFLGKADSEEARAPFLASIPLGRLSTPEDLANAALYLASDEASMITGVLLEIDGGRCV